MRENIAFANHVSDVNLVARICKELLQVNNKNVNNPIKSRQSN